jgi:fatty-acyl-CoA synthase
MPFASLQDIKALEQVPFDQQVRASTAYELMAEQALRQPDTIAVSFMQTGAVDTPVEDVTYGQFLARVHQMAHLFHHIGVESHNAVSMLLPGTADTFAAMFAAHLVGRANPINFMLEPDHIAALLQAAQSRVLLVPDEGLLPGIIEKLPDILAKLDQPIAVYRVGGPVQGNIPALAEAIADMPTTRPVFWTPPAAQDLAALFHTGGTTSAPKLAGHTHGGILRHAWVMAQAWHGDPQDVFLNGLPPFHVGGGYAAGLMPLTRGARVIIATAAGMRNRDLIGNLWKHVERFRPTVLAMVPTSWGAALNTPVDGADVSSVRLCHAGGAAMPVEMAKTVERTLGCQIVEGWGMTELHGFGTMNPGLGECRIGSVGHRVPFVELCVAQVEQGRITRQCAPDEIGRLLVRGAQVFPGYLDPAHNQGAWVEPQENEIAPDWSIGGPWLDTGDLARMDAEEYVWLTGRAKDTIIRGGHNIDPLTIEEVLYTHPAVEVAAAVGQPDEYAGELPMAFVQLKTGASVDPETLRDFARDRIAERAALPAAIVVLETLPTTAVGKIFKPELRLLAAQRVISDRIAAALPDVPDVVVHCVMDARRGPLARVILPETVSLPDMEKVQSLLSLFSIASDVGSDL